jgi:hypothetical protein
MRDIFACRECQSIYEITRVSQPPVLTPFCRNCGCKFPPSELGDWLAYERAEPEWTVDAWLRGALEVPHNVRHDEIAPLELATEQISSARRVSGEYAGGGRSDPALGAITKAGAICSPHLNCAPNRPPAHNTTGLQDHQLFAVYWRARDCA